MSEKLSSYAVSENTSLGRRFEEQPHRYRSGFERDRDRIIHSSAFRRLEGKTQVFTPGLDDYYRTRLTHSIEVSQIGRTIARALGVNENLTEAICLAHDLGHSPFGHTGEKILNELMSGLGGFEHNCQSLRVVNLLEHPYPDFPGLNLMYETRLGLAKHRSTYDNPHGEAFSEANCSLEGQIADIADRIAYNCHDLEDGLRAGVIDEQLLKSVEIYNEAQSRVHADAIVDSSVRSTRTAKTIIDTLVSDCINTSRKAIGNANIKTVDEVCSKSENLILVSLEYDAKLVELENFLMQHFYLHKTVIQTADEIRDWLERLFQTLCERPVLMPVYFQHLAETQSVQRAVCDYIAGMTDRFCLKMLEKI